MNTRILSLLCTLTLVGCLHEPPTGLAPASPAAVTVDHDFEYRPMPRIPLPNDIATRYDATSPTGRRINASLVAPTQYERRTREMVDALDGWGTYMPITIPFSDLIDLTGLMARHHGDEADLSDDTIYLIDLQADSPTYGEPLMFDVGQGHFPLTLEEMDGYWGGDARGDTITLLLEEHDEDLDGDGVLDQGEDTDLDGVLDRPNYLPGITRRMDEMTLSERARAMMTFYERETNTLILRPLRPLRERSRYGVVITRRLHDMQGDPVGSPYAGINHSFHTDALAPLASMLTTHADTYGGLGLEDVAFAWTFTTGTAEKELQVVRDGLYGHGVQAHLAGEFPAELSVLHPLWSGETQHEFENLYTLSGETFLEVIPLATAAGLVGGGGLTFELLQQSLAYVDYHVFGTFRSPQLFDRLDEDGNQLDWNDMSWPPDLTTTPAKTRSEDVSFWLTIPRKVVSKRGHGEPAPLAILGHGYTLNRTEIIDYHGAFARRGLATLSLDNVSHGIGLSDDEREGLGMLLGLLGAEPLAEAIAGNRTLDLNGDGTGDSGGDFWTAYAFHTRDVVRQSAVDYMQLARILRAWDGERTWPYDTNEDGVADDIAGDFDGDGRVDIGGDGSLTMTGTSLGGIMAAIMAGIEPHFDATVPIAGGGGLSDVGNRSLQGGVRESVQLRVMGPLYIGDRRDDGGIEVMAVVPNLNATARIPVATIPAEANVQAGDSILVENLDNGEYDCALVLPGSDSSPDSVFRLGVASTIPEGDPERHRIRVWSGLVFDASKRDVEHQRACSLLPGAGEPIVEIDAFDRDVSFFYRGRPLSFEAGATLSPLAEGLGLPRARPALRRFMSFAQMILGPGDPVVYAQHVQSGEMTFATGEVVNTSMLVVNTVGDMNVPVSTGANIGRAAGFIDHVTPIAEWGGRTVAQVLVDTGVLEAVDTVGHFTDPDGVGVLFDPEDLSRSASSTSDTFDWTLPPGPGPFAFEDALPRGEDGYAVPRLSPPLREHAVFQDAAGGLSGTFFPFIKPGGQHGSDPPGYHHSLQVAWCEASADDPTTCAQTDWYDNGATIWDLVTHYLASGGTFLPTEPCTSALVCDDTPPPPPARP